MGGTSFPEHFVKRSALFDCEPATGRWPTLRLARSKVTLGVLWEFDWSLNNFAFVARRTFRWQDQNGVRRQEYHGIAVYHHRGRWSWAVQTKRWRVRGGGPSPYSHDGRSDIGLMIVRP